MFSTIQQPLDPAIYYARDLELNVNGKDCLGVCVVPRADIYVVKIQSSVDVDELVITSCKRTEAIPSVIDVNWFHKKRGYTYVYAPTTIEDEPDCSLKIGGFDKDKGQNAWGMILFETQSFKAHAGIACNSEKDYGANGMAVCQAMRGQKMKIWFEHKAELSPAVLPQCQFTTNREAQSFEFEIKDRECRYVFKDETTNELFSLFTIGAEQIAIRGQ